MLAAMLADLYIIYICMYIYIYMCIYIYIYIYIPPWQTVHNVHELPQSYCSDNREDALFFDCIYILHPSHLCEIWPLFVYLYFYTSLMQDLKIRGFLSVPGRWQRTCLKQADIEKKTILWNDWSERTDLYQNKCVSLFGRMQCCPNKRIHIRALSQHSHKKRKDFCFLSLWSQNYFWDWIKRVNPMECNVNDLTYIKKFSFFSWIGSSRNKRFFLQYLT